MADINGMNFLSISTVAVFAGVQLCEGICPDIELWTLRQNLGPDLVEGSTLARQTIEKRLALVNAGEFEL